MADRPHFRFYGAYTGSEPAFYAPEDLPWTDVLRRNWTVFRQEFEECMAREPDALQPKMVPDPVSITGWVGVNFVTCLARREKNCRRFPKTVAVLESIPNLASAFINVLEPHASLPPHDGDTNTLYRAHLGLVVPGDVDECGIQVGDERSGWKEGEVLVFNDARRHFVWNRSDRPRVILVCDVVKPQYGGASPRSCSMVLGSIVIEFLQTRARWVSRLPRWLLRGLHELVSSPFHVYLALFGMQRQLARARRR
jgi:hypothetical protein